MSPIESEQLAEMREELRGVGAKLDALHKVALAQALFGARPWVPVVVALLALVIAAGAAVRVEYVVERHQVSRIEGGIYP